MARARKSSSSASAGSARKRSAASKRKATAKKTASQKKTAAARSSGRATVSAPLDKLAEEIGKRRAEAERSRRVFTALTDEQLLQKLLRTRSPLILYQSWTGASPGGAVQYALGLHNPDPTPWEGMFVHVSVGPGNIVAGGGGAVDERFPCLTEPASPGLTIAPSSTQELEFALAVPDGIEPSNYIGNAFLLHVGWHDAGACLDRSVFVFDVA